VLTCVLQEQRFGEVLSVAESLDVEGMKKAVRKSRVMFNRGGADDKPADTGEQQPHRHSSGPCWFTSQGPMHSQYMCRQVWHWHEPLCGAAAYSMKSEQALGLLRARRRPCKVLP
jgi:hypothetical protein